MRRGTEGAYGITGAGVDTSSVSFGAAISKAITIAARLQRELGKDDEPRSLYVRRLGQDVEGRVDYGPRFIAAHHLGR